MKQLIGTVALAIVFIVLADRVAVPLESYGADSSNAAAAGAGTNAGSQDKAFLDYVKVVQDEDRKYRESVENLFTKLEYILGITGGLVVVVTGVAGIKSYKEIKGWLKNIGEAQIASKMAEIDSKIAELKKQVDTSLESARKLDEERIARQKQIDDKTSKFEERLRNISERVNSDIIYLFVEEREWPILKMLADGQPDHYKLSDQPALKDMLRRLRDRLELIRMQPKPGGKEGDNYWARDIPPEGDLKKYCKLTEKGQTLVGIRLKEEAQAVEREKR